MIATNTEAKSSGAAAQLCAVCLQELQAQLDHRADLYNRLLDQGESMILARGVEEAGLGTTQTQQNLALLQNKWAILNAKMDDRRVRRGNGKIKDQVFFLGLFLVKLFFLK